jgi:hypothetical protein
MWLAHNRSEKRSKTMFKKNYLMVVARGGTHDKAACCDLALNRGSLPELVRVQHDRVGFFFTIYPSVLA